MQALACPILDLLACPDCRGPLIAHPDLAELSCPACGVRVPVSGGFPLFSDRQVGGGSLRGPESWKGESATGDARWLAAAHRSPADAYAAFQPFNESCRTVASFVPLLRSLLRPGDAILDTWNRTGWTGELLAGLFPEQRIVSLWEGNHGALGYRGFAHWLGPGRGARNAHVVFHRPDEPLPFATGAFAAVHGYDTLHRYRLDLWLAELARVTRPEGPMLFPHVHLSNGRPEPFFEREGIIRHGREHADTLTRAFGNGTRRVYVMGERRLFETQDAPAPPRLAHDPETDDYNAMVAVLPAEWAGLPLVPEGLPEPLETAAVLPNPLCRVGLHDGRVTIDTDPDGVAARVLARHPVYAERLRARLPWRLDPTERAILYWAERVPDVASIAVRLFHSAESLRPFLERLQHQELVRVVRIGRGAARLQRFQGRRETAPFVDEDDLPGVWRRAVSVHGDRPYLIDDQGRRTITFAETDDLVRAVRSRLRAAGLSPGDRVAVDASLHVEAVLLFWAGMHEHLTLAMLDPEWPAGRVLEVLERVQPALVFTDAAHAARARDWTGALVVFDEDEPGEEAPPRGEAFSSWLRDEDFTARPEPLAANGADRAAVVLFTSGTTGDPKGVVQAQHALAHSGRLLAAHGDLRAEDVHLGLSDLHTMSGLRNPCVAAVQAGAAIVIPSRETRGQPLAVADCIARWSVTLLTAVPGMLRLLTRAADRMPPGQLVTLRRVLSTGARLPVAVSEAFRARFGAPVHDYYGLTETAGLCIGRPPELDLPEGSIGRAVDALIRVVDQGGADVEAGREGELWIHSANLMEGYLDDEAGTRAAFAGHWYRTGDIVRVSSRGDVELVGRCREIVKNVHGEIVPLREIEEALLACSDVADAGVFVTRHDEGEFVHAVVVPRDGLVAHSPWLDAVRAGLLERVGPRKMPSRLLVRDGIPRMGGAKVPLSELSLGWLDDVAD